MRQPKNHDLKTVNPFFTDVFKGHKPFEIRKNDRDFQLGDTLTLREWDDENEAYIGRHIIKEVIYMTSYAQKDGYVVMGVR